MPDRHGKANQSVLGGPGSGSGTRVRRRILIVAGLVLLTPVFVVALVLLHFSGVLDERLAGSAGLRVPLIYSAPRRISRDQVISIGELARYLDRAGYGPSSTRGTCGPMRPDPDSLEIHPGKESYFGSSNALRVEFAGGRIRRIVALDSGAELEQAEVEPELITSLSGAERDRRRPVRYSDLPAHLVAAVLAAEDKRFFDHPGVDPIRIVGAARFDILHGSKAQGGSTLTMQLSRSLFFDREREWSRKLAEAFMALLMEARFTKNEIFELYANEIYLGNRGGFAIHGFGEAARSYFGKDVQDLSPGESCFLAGIIRSPNRYSEPQLDPGRAESARDRILELLERGGNLSSREAESARATPLRFVGSRRSTGTAPYFVDMVRMNLLGRDRDSERDLAGSSVYTTLDTGLQADATAAVEAGVRRIEAQLAPGVRSRKRAEQRPVQAALVALDVGSGRIRALVGGRDYQQSQLNRALASRQPGSVFKPFVYASAFSTALDGSPRVMTPATVVIDEPSTFVADGRTWSPVNYGGEYSGSVTLREALTRSLNVATVKVAEEVGYLKIVDLMHLIVPDLRIEPTPSVALGSYEMTPLQVAAAYTVFARAGLQVEPWFVDRVRWQGGSVEDSHQVVERAALDPRVAFLVTSIMRNVIDEGTGVRVRSLGFTAPAAGKTGTSRDGWFAGFTPDLLCVVWVGFDDNTELGLAGGSSAAVIWAEFMKRAAVRPGYDRSGDFGVPEGIEVRPVDPETGMLAQDCPMSRPEFFIEGTSPTERCDLHRGLRWAELSPFRWAARLFQGGPPADAPLEAAPRADLLSGPAHVVHFGGSSGDAVPALPEKQDSGSDKKNLLQKLFGLFKRGRGDK